MGIWDALRGELVDIVEWLDDTQDTIVWRFPRYENEIKYGAKLIVRDGRLLLDCRPLTDDEIDEVAEAVRACR